MLAYDGGDAERPSRAGRRPPWRRRSSRSGLRGVSAARQHAQRGWRAPASAAASLEPVVDQHLHRPRLEQIEADLGEHDRQHGEQAAPPAPARSVRATEPAARRLCRWRARRRDPAAATADGPLFGAMRAHARRPPSPAAELQAVQLGGSGRRASQQLRHACPARRPGRARARRSCVALRIVDSRWAMMNVVRPRISRSERLDNGVLGIGVERAGRLVEDQDRRVLEQRPGDGDALALAARQRRAALADARCRSPRGSAAMKSCALAARAAASISSRVASGRPKAMFSAMLIGNRNGSWSTTATCSRRLAELTGRARRGRRSARGRPSGSKKRGISPTSVLLPAPVSPDDRHRRRRPARDARRRAAPAAPAGSRTSTFSKTTSPRTGGSAGAPGALGNAVVVRRTPPSRGRCWRRPSAAWSTSWRRPTAATAATRGRRGRRAPCRRSAGRRARASRPST